MSSNFYRNSLKIANQHLKITTSNTFKTKKSPVRGEMAKSPYLEEK